MKRLSALAVALAFVAAGCGSSTSPSSTTPTKPTVTAALSPANEVPPITNAESSGTGTATITFDVTRDSAGNVTAVSSTTFVVNLTGFPAGTTITAAHVHKGDRTCACPVVISAAVVSGANVLGSGAGSFTQVVANADPAVVQDILNNSGNYYFNVHSTLNPGGFARGQLSRVQ